MSEFQENDEHADVEVHIHSSENQVISTIHPKLLSFMLRRCRTETERETIRTLAAEIPSKLRWNNNQTKRWMLARCNNYVEETLVRRISKKRVRNTAREGVYKTQSHYINPTIISTKNDCENLKIEITKSKGRLVHRGALSNNHNKVYPINNKKSQNIEEGRQFQIGASSKKKRLQHLR